MTPQRRWSPLRTMTRPCARGLLGVALAFTAPVARAAESASVSVKEDMSAAVLPITFRAGGLSTPAMMTVLTTALTTHLGAAGRYQVLSADEVATLLQVESNRQELGSLDGDAVQEIAAALGARFAVIGEVVPLGVGLMWTTSIVERASGAAVQRVSVRASRAEAFLAQARDVALRLSGRPAELDVDSANARRRFGFLRKADFREFVTYRENNRHLTASEALTAFISERNRESPRLALAEVAAFGTAAGLVSVAFFVSTLSFGARALVPAYGLALGGSVVALGILGAAVVSGVVGLGLVAWDARDVGYVTLRANGCCRDDDAIRDDESRDEGLRAAALAVVFAAPASMAANVVLGAVAGVILLGIGGMVATAPVAFPKGLGQETLLLAEVGAAYPLVIAIQLLVFLPLFVGTPVGLFLFAWPKRPSVPAESATRGVPAGRGAPAADETEERP